MKENICRQCLTEEFRTSLKKPFAETLLSTDRIDGWAEKKYDMVKLPENWYIINYASGMFTENGKYRQMAIHLKTTENDTKIDGISTTPAEDKTLVKYIRSMCVDINSLENVYKPHFKTTGDGSSIIALCSVKEVGNKTASVSFISTWDGKFKDIKVDDEYRKSYNPKSKELESGGKVSAKVKKIIVNKLLSLPDFPSRNDIRRAHERESTYGCHVRQ